MLIHCSGCGELREHKAKGLCGNCYMRKLYAENKEYREKKLRYTRAGNREKKLRQKYGITLAEYDEMLEIQGGVCIICGRTPEENGKRLAVDHNHQTGKVRGLLCDNCNWMLGNARDDPQLLRRGADYLDTLLTENQEEDNDGTENIHSGGTG